MGKYELPKTFDEVSEVLIKAFGYAPEKSKPKLKVIRGGKTR